MVKDKNAPRWLWKPRKVALGGEISRTRGSLETGHPGCELWFSGAGRAHWPPRPLPRDPPRALPRSCEDSYLNRQGWEKARGAAVLPGWLLPTLLVLARGGDARRPVPAGFNGWEGLGKGSKPSGINCDVEMGVKRGRVLFCFVIKLGCWWGNQAPTLVD